MEGWHGEPPAALAAFAWAPRWNSVQALNKFQDEIGGPWRDGDPGVRLFDGAARAPRPRATEPWRRPPSRPRRERCSSCRAGTRSQATPPRSARRRWPRARPAPAIALHPGDADAAGLADGARASLRFDGAALAAPVRTGRELPRGVATFRVLEACPASLPGRAPSGARCGGRAMSRALYTLLMVVVMLGGLLAVAAMMTWVERRALALWQDRYGPNRAGPFGLLQPLADVIKLFTKEDWTPPFADRAVFVLAPAIAFAALAIAFAIVPVSPAIGVADLSIGLLFFLAMSSIAVYSVILGGWASNSKYSLLGGLRAAAQMVSYEVFMGLSLMGVVVLAGSFDLRAIVHAQEGMWFVGPQFLGFVVFAIAGVAEAHRLPFDLPEAENELTAGYHTEYSAMKFGLFFVGEYVAMVVIAAMTTTLFLGGWLGAVPAAGGVVRAQDRRAASRLRRAARRPAAAALRPAHGVRLENRCCRSRW